MGLVWLIIGGSIVAIVGAIIFFRWIKNIYKR